MTTALRGEVDQLRLWWVGFTTFILRSYKDIVRYSILTIAPPAVMTALYFLVFGELIGPRIGTVSGVDYERFIAPGLVILPVIVNAYSQTALSFFTAKFHKTLDEHLLSPQPGWIIVISYVSGGLVRAILAGIAVGVIARLFTHAHLDHPALMIGALILVSLVASLAGFINAVFATSFEQINWFLSFALAPLVYCGGVFYSLSLLPAWAQRLSLSNPIFYMVDLFRYAMLGVDDTHAGMALSIMLFAVPAMFVFSVALVKRGIGIKE